MHFRLDRLAGQLRTLFGYVLGQEPRLDIVTLILIDQPAYKRRSLLGKNSETHDQLLVGEIVVF